MGFRNDLNAPLPGEFSADPHAIGALPVLVIHAHTSCNCRCAMCDIWKTPESKSFGLAELRRQLDSLRALNVRWVAFSGGEPLLNPELFAMCALLRAENIRLTLLTTGLLLKKLAPQIAEHFDDVIVSLDGPPAIHNAVRRVEGAFALIESGIAAVRREHPAMAVSARCTVQKANHAHLRETALAAKSIGCDRISFLAADLTSTAFNRPLIWPADRQNEIALSLPEIAVLESEIDALIVDPQAELGRGFVAESPEKLRRIARHFRAHLGLLPARAPICNAPWVSAVVETDGSVRPCFFHPVVGNLQKESLQEIVNSSAARAFRANLDVAANPVCRNCVCSLNYRA